MEKKATWPRRCQSKNIDQDQNEGEEEESNALATQEAKELIAQLFKQRTGDSNTKNTSAQSKHEEDRWKLKTLKCRMECANRKKKSYRCKPDMGLDVVIRNVKQKTPIVDSGKVKKATWPYRRRSERTLIRTRTREKRQNRTLRQRKKHRS